MTLIYVVEYFSSISPDECIHPACSNRASVNTYPVCYQHLDFFSQQQPWQPAASTEGIQWYFILLTFCSPVLIDVSKTLLKTETETSVLSTVFNWF